MSKIRSKAKPHRKSKTMRNPQVVSFTLVQDDDEARTNEVHFWVFCSGHCKVFLQRKSKNGSKPFYGFCYIEGNLAKHPVEFPVLLKIHLLWAQGCSIHRINQELDK